MRKSTRKKKHPAICAYCGTEGTDWTDDEPVPKCLFMPPKDNLIRVPACAKCNNELKSIDDTFLRDMIATDPAASSHPDIAFLRRPFWRSVQKGTSPVVVTRYGKIYQDPVTGLYLPNRMSISIRKARVRRIFGWIVRGLYYDWYKKPLPKSYRVGCSRIDPAEGEKREKFLESQGIHPKWLIGRGQFKYVHLGGYGGDPFVTFWQMALYDGIWYEVSTVPPGTHSIQGFDALIHWRAAVAGIDAS